jgi:hypothetical protein
MARPTSSKLNIDMRTKDNYSLPTMKSVKSLDGKTIHPFYTTRYPFSNFYPAEFEVDGNFQNDF